MPTVSPLLRCHSLSLLIVGALLVPWLTGCGEQEAIRQYTVPKAEGLGQDGEAGADGQEEPRSGSTDRTIAAMLPHGEQTWFFKVMGPNEAVAAKKDEILAVVKSVEFNDDGEPTWTLPEGWERQAGTQFRFATLAFQSGETPLEMSVTPLPTAMPVYDDYILENVNRWRGELGLRKVSKEELFEGEQPSGELTRIEQDGTTITVVDLVGQRGPSGMRRPPFAGRMPPSAEGPPQRPATTDAPASDLTFTVPEGWTEAANDPFSRQAFNIESDGAQGRMTVTAAGGDLLANVNRWRQQRGLEPWSAEQLQSEAQEITIDGQAGTVVHFREPGDDPSRQATLGAIVPRDGRLWFFKLTGPAALTEREQPRFESFLQSVQFESP